jgi:hypothetical protein
MENETLTLDTDSEKIERLEASQLASLRTIRLAALALEAGMTDLLIVGPPYGYNPEEVEAAKSVTWAPVDKSLQRLANVIGMLREAIPAPPVENLENLIASLNSTIATLEEQQSARLSADLKARRDAQFAKVGRRREGPALAGTRVSELREANSRLRQSLADAFPDFPDTAQN